MPATQRTPSPDPAPGSAAPTFEQATKLRHKAWSAGFDPNHWYAVEFASRVGAGQVVDVVFQGQSVAVFRGADGTLRAIENRCAHRQVKLSDGYVKDCALVCRYHGWTFDGEGRLTGYDNDLAERQLVKARVRQYPVAARYGLTSSSSANPSWQRRAPCPW